MTACDGKKETHQNKNKAREFFYKITTNQRVVFTDI